MFNIGKYVVFACVVSYSSLVMSATSITIPGASTQVALSVREQPVQQFINTLFSQVGTPVVISERVVGVVNGKFDGTFNDVFGRVASAFNVTVYYDGVVAHVYKANESQRKLMPVSSAVAKHIRQMAGKLGIGDSYNFVDSDGMGGLMVTGTERYLEQIEELSFAARK